MNQAVLVDQTVKRHARNTQLTRGVRDIAADAGAIASQSTATKGPAARREH